MTDEASTSSTSPLRIALPALALLVAAVIVRTALAPDHLSGDAAAYVLIGDRVRDGAVVYRDLFELNPPWVMWLNGGFSHVATLLGLRTASLVSVGTTLAAIASALFVRHEARRGGVSATAADALAWVMMGLFSQTWIQDHAERDQWLLIALVPYVVLRWRRSHGAVPPLPLSLLLGVATGTGALFKPHFVALIALLELGIALSSRSVRRLLEPEPVAMLLPALVYAGLFAAMPDDARAYFVDVHLPAVAIGYDRFNGSPFDAPYLNCGLALVSPLLAFITWQRRDRDAQSRLAWYVALAALLATVSYFTQAKFWDYHRILPVNLTALAVLLHVSPWLASAELATMSLVGEVAAGAVTAVWLMMFMAAGEKPSGALADIGTHIVDHAPPGEPIFLIATTFQPYRFAVPNGNPVDRSFLWDYPAGLAGEPGADGHVPLLPGYGESLVVDLERTKARWVYVEERFPCRFCAADVSLPRVLAQTGAQEVLTRRFVQVDTIGNFAVWHLREPAPAAEPQTPAAPAAEPPPATP